MLELDLARPPIGGSDDPAHGARRLHVGEHALERRWCHLDHGRAFWHVAGDGQGREHVGSGERAEEPCLAGLVGRPLRDLHGHGHGRDTEVRRALDFVERIASERFQLPRERGRGAAHVEHGIPDAEGAVVRLVVGIEPHLQIAGERHANAIHEAEVLGQPKIELIDIIEPDTSDRIENHVDRAAAKLGRAGPANVGTRC